jgi:uncharacterized protein YyaL (SSP411 family)
MKWSAVAVGVLCVAVAYGIWSQTGSEREESASTPEAPGTQIGPEAAASGRSDAPAPSRAYPRPGPGPGLNLLALEASPYLQLHAHNPVDWYPWEAFARARAENKPVFLSVGYSTCYWCHVMEREVFSDPAIAAQMNAHFISIKVDREERPDIDDIYMKATQLLTGSGGWPNSVFLTPDAKPFYAGTYFPPEDDRGRPGFPSVLRSLHEAWTNQPEKVLAAALQITQRIEALNDPGDAERSPPPPADEGMRQALAKLRSGFDAEHGGFGRRQKFARPPTLGLLLTELERRRDPEIEAMLVRTLDAMALGGINDHLADGFHRYSTEPTWSIPHFEKMLYDNAQLASVYARAYALTGRPLYARVVERTLAYLDREMSLPEGGFASAQDAEVDGEEGASYVWSRAGIERVLGAEQAEAFLSVYELVPMPEHPESGVLRVRLPLAELLERAHASDAAALLARFDVARAALLARRATRPQPLRDDKVLAAWNGLAIRGLVDAAAALGRPEYLRRAERAAHFVLARLLTQEGALRRSYIAGQAREDGVLDDYAFVADGLLALGHATGDPRWLAAARRLADVLLARFEDATGGGFFLTPEDSSLLVRPKPFEDGALPSGNGVALRVLRSLAAGVEGERYAAAADGIESSAGALLLRAPDALPTTLAALASTPGPGAAGIARAGARPEAEHARSDPVDPFRLPRSEDHVRARLVSTADADRAGLVVRIAIDEGWHVNANPASFPFLVATSVEPLEGNAVVAARYPEGRDFRPGFAPRAIRVYEGTVEIPVRLQGGVSAPKRLALRFQACDATRCLPPHRAVLSLDAPAAAGP